MLNCAKLDRIAFPNLSPRGHVFMSLVSVQDALWYFKGFLMMPATKFHHCSGANEPRCGRHQYKECMGIDWLGVRARVALETSSTLLTVLKHWPLT